jgi:hypothetical protein
MLQYHCLSGNDLCPEEERPFNGTKGLPMGLRSGDIGPIYKLMLDVVIDLF